MRGYVVKDTEVIDAEAYAEFMEKYLAAIDAHGDGSSCVPAKLRQFRVSGCRSVS